MEFNYKQDKYTKVSVIKDFKGQWQEQSEQVIHKCNISVNG